MIRIDVEHVSLTEKACKKEIVFAAVPLAANPADAFHEPQGCELGDDQILGALAVQFEQIDLVDPYITKLLPKIFRGDAIDL